MSDKLIGARNFFLLIYMSAELSVRDIESKWAGRIQETYHPYLNRKAVEMFFDAPGNAVEGRCRRRLSTSL